MKILEKAIEVALIPVEKEALEQWEEQGLPKISITTAAKYYDLYLQGSSCSENRCYESWNPSWGCS